jgi:hypothetical protein
MLTRLGLVFCLNMFLAQVCLATQQTVPLPQWLLKAIEAEKKSPNPGKFEEATYEGKRVFEFIRGDRFDTGDEHILFSEDGKEICKFGGFVPRVTSGACDFAKVRYVRTLCVSGLSRLRSSR